MPDEFTPSVEAETNPGPTLEEQAVEMGFMEDGSPAQEAAPQQDLILGKFENQEALAEAYTQLEQRMGQGVDAPVALTQASEFYSQNGYLDDANYEGLAAMGLNRAIVDNYLAGVQAQHTNTQSEYFSLTGGEDGYQQMAQWMSQYLPETEINAYNRVLDSGSDEEVAMLISGMHSRYQAAIGGGYTQLQGGPAESLPEGFESRAQIMEAMGDPRYEVDEAFRQAVEDKLAVTPDTVF